MYLANIVFVSFQGVECLGNEIYLTHFIRMIVSQYVNTQP